MLQTPRTGVAVNAFLTTIVIAVDAPGSPPPQAGSLPLVWSRIDFPLALRVRKWSECAALRTGTPIEGSRQKAKWT